jgi:Hydrazine synthase alpha subunit middle domain/NPCBM/NEW2 domain
MKTKTLVSILIALAATTPTKAFQPVQTKVIRGGEPAQTIRADVTSVKDLFLVATIGPDTYNYDQAIWAEPKLFDKDGREVDLTTLKPASTQVGWGEFVVNRAHGNQPLSIAGQSYAKGFYAHAPSVLHFRLDGGFTRFEAQVGIYTGSGKNGSCEFIVTQVKPRTAPPRKGDPPPPPVTAKLSPADQAPHQFNTEAANILLARGIEKIVFVRRFTLTSNHIYTEHVNSRWTPGGGLCVLDLRTGVATELLPEMRGGVFNRFDVSYDAKKILFDYKKSAREGYRIYEVGVDGRNLRQLTFPVEDEEVLVQRYGRGDYHHGTDDMHPCYLPDGDIVFTSTRCRASVLCDSSDGFTTTVLHRMTGDGQNIRRLSGNCVSEFSPAALPDGRVLYMRWEYNRKGAGAVKCLWAMRPDGTATSEVYGDNIVDPETMIYGRPIPGAPDKIVFLGCSHWGPNNALGTVIVLDTKVDTQSRSAMTFISRDVDAQTHGGFSFLVDGKWIHETTGKPGRLFKDPYPLSEQLFLVAHKPRGLTWHDPKGYDLSLLDDQGRETLLYRDGEISCWHPYPLCVRPVPPRPATPLRQELADRQLAQCVVADVYTGLQGVPRGAVKHLRILEQTPRPWAARTPWNDDRQAMAHSTVGLGILGMIAQHGVVPVEDDGSANFYVPAGRNIYFQALDENYMAIQTERTYINYMAGEIRSCVGCHDRSRTAAGDRPIASSKALRRAPSMPGPQPGEADGRRLFDYARQIQPIWDRNCVRCHANGKTAAGLDLTGTLTSLYSVSYENLLAKDKTKRVLPLVGMQADENDVRGYVEYTPPYYFGSYSSLLAATFGDFTPRFESFAAHAPKLAARVEALRKQHQDVKLTREEFIRLVNWLDASCQYYGSYWGQKNIEHRASPCFRPEVTFDEALSPQCPPALKAVYEPAKVSQR